MKTLKPSLLAVALLSIATVTPSFAQSAPGRGEELIDGISLAPGQPVGLWFPNKFDLDHHKKLTLDVWA